MQLFVFGISSPGVDHLQLYQLVICTYFFFHLKNCFEKYILGKFNMCDGCVVMVT